MKPSITRPSENHDTEATTLAPRRSPKEMEQLESERRAQMLSCLEELLAVSAEMPEHELPLPQADIVAELSAAGAAEPLVACLHVKNLPEARLHSAGTTWMSCSPGPAGACANSYSAVAAWSLRTEAEATYRGYQDRQLL